MLGIVPRVKFGLSLWKFKCRLGTIPRRNLDVCSALFGRHWIFHCEKSRPLDYSLWKIPTAGFFTVKTFFPKVKLGLSLWKFKFRLGKIPRRTLQPSLRTLRSGRHAASNLYLRRNPNFFDVASLPLSRQLDNLTTNYKESSKMYFRNYIFHNIEHAQLYLIQWLSKNSAKIQFKTLRTFHKLEKVKPCKCV